MTDKMRCGPCPEKGEIKCGTDSYIACDISSRNGTLVLVPGAQQGGPGQVTVESAGPSREGNAQRHRGKKCGVRLSSHRELLLLGPGLRNCNREAMGLNLLLH